MAQVRKQRRRPPADAKIIVLDPCNENAFYCNGLDHATQQMKMLIDMGDCGPQDLRVFLVKEELEIKAQTTFDLYLKERMR